MGLYTKIYYEIETYYEVVSINWSLSLQNFYLQVLVLLLSFFLCFWWWNCLLFKILNIFEVGERFFNIFIILSIFSSQVILFYSNLFISSLTLDTGIPIFSSKNCILLAFCSISMWVSDIVSPTIFITCLKT